MGSVPQKPNERQRERRIDHRAVVDPRSGPRKKRAAAGDYFALLLGDKREQPDRGDRFIISRTPVIVAQQVEHVATEAKQHFGNVVRFGIEHGTPIVHALPGVEDLIAARAQMMASGSVEDAGWLDRSWLAINDLHGDYKTIWTRAAPDETTACAVLAQQLGLRTSPVAVLALIAVLAQTSVVAAPVKRYLGGLFIDAARRIKARARRAEALAALDPTTADDDGCDDWGEIMRRVKG